MNPKDAPLVAGEFVSYALTMTDQVLSQNRFKRKQVGMPFGFGENRIDNVRPEDIGVASIVGYLRKPLATFISLNADTISPFWLRIARFNVGNCALTWINRDKKDTVGTHLGDVVVKTHVPDERISWCVCIEHNLRRWA